jgi:16S rRNA (guanine966-N2)-methyltransferase
MRIIAGEFRGQKLLAPEGETTRPVTDRAKQSIFDVLSDRPDDAVVYDCFAGTGSFGLECLSRGAKSATFFESDQSALKLLRENIRKLRVEDRSTVIAGDIFKLVSRQIVLPAKADLIFFDPPYRFVHERPAELRKLAESLVSNHLSKIGLLVFRHHSANALDLPHLTRENVREYGEMLVEFLIHMRADHP